MADPKTLQKWANLRGYPSLVFAPGVAIREDHLLKVERLTRAARGPELDLILHSGGGDPHVAFRLVCLLRARYEVLHAVVPSFAMSAASLLALACDAIAFSPRGHIGPLDMQRGSWDASGAFRQRSTVADINNVDYLIRFATDVCRYAWHEDLHEDNDPVGSMERAVILASETVAPLMSGSTLTSLGEASRAQWFGIDYATRALAMRRNPPNDPSRLAERLAFAYPDHGFAIDREECRRLELPVEGLAAGQTELITRLGPALLDLTADDEIMLVLPGPAPALKPRTRPSSRTRTRDRNGQAPIEVK